MPLFPRFRFESSLIQGFALSLTILGLATLSHGQETGELSSPSILAAPEKLEIEAFPGAIVDKVVVPVPAEIFAVLDKLDEPNWAAQVHLPEMDRPETDRLRLALIFGATVGEGFIAVEAEQAKPIQDIGRRVLRLAEALGLQDAVVPHCQSIIDSADLQDWRKVRAEFDRTQQTVRDTMEELQDHELSSLVSLGGWLRGTQALTNLVSEAYNHDKAELLNQPDLVSHFRDTISSMKDRTRDHVDVDAVENGLGEILEALSEAEGDGGGDSGGVVSAGTVKRMGETCDALLKRFYQDPATDQP